MRNRISKSNADEALLNRRLEEIRMSTHERLRAKADLARAEAFANAAGEIINLIKRLAKFLVVRPFQRLTHSFE